MPRANEKLRTGFNANSPLLLVNDSAGSVVATVTAGQWRGISYSPYGVRHPQAVVSSLLGFNGAKPDTATGHYLLGNGYRGFNPVVMRFNSPDRLSPFERGGLNTYAYCLGDPINRQDPSGNVSFFKAMRRLITGSTRTPPMARRESLTNRRASKLDFELNHVQRYTQSVGQDPRTLITQQRDLVAAARHGKLKYVVNDLGELAVGPFRPKSDPSYVSHPTLANLLSGNRIVSAGLIKVNKIDRKKLTITNTSGHYRPDTEHLTPGVRKLEQLGFKVRIVRRFF